MDDQTKLEKAANDRLREALEQLEALSGANQALLKTLSHDLRTPLNTIIGFADMMEQETLGPINEPQYRGYVSDIHRAGRSMLDIINDLLDFGRFESFKEKEKDFRHIIDLAPDLICICRSGAIKMINPAGADMLGVWKAETLVDRKISDFVHADYREIFGEQIENLMAEKMRVPMLFLRPDGRTVDVEVAALPYKEEGADGPSVMLIARDVSARNRALKMAAARENHIRKIMDTVVDGIITFDRRGVIETINPAAEKIFGYDPGELIGRNVRILMNEPLAADHAGYKEEETESERTRILGADYQVEGRRKDRSKFPVEIAVGMLKDGQRRIYIGALRDITERKEHEERTAGGKNEVNSAPAEMDSWRSKLHRVLIHEIEPDAFERLVMRLLRESGFVQVEVTARSKDGGVDGKGILKVGGLLSFHVLFQCKKYQGSVSSSAIRYFRGALVGRADKGLFVTTGSFTRYAAREAVR
ncbi:MAG: PAS domain S-box protein, partial [Proteobacteria bacterium]|nr:PAS domain S-box protein [Pseudomonadota bacterium]